MEKIFYIDLFSGAGGTTSGIHLTNGKAKVVACVNHDANAIKSHKANHPDCMHFVEDVRNFDVVLQLQKLVENLRANNPGCIIILWASLECTNYSNAKGGQPRDADSRTLANTLFMKYNPKTKKYIEEDSYMQLLQPDYVMIENVREFMSWGPLDENGRPISRLKGVDYLKWVKNMQSFQYGFQSRLLDSANYGAYTKRVRYFAQFAKGNLPIAWPTATHTEKLVEQSLFGNNLNSWKPVREVLDLNDEGQSIFERKVPLVEKTLNRIYAGLIKFVAHGDTSFLTSYYGNSKGAQSVDKPAPTITTKDRFNKIQAKFITNYYSGGGQLSSIEKPSPVIMGVPKQRLCSCVMIDQQYGNSLPASVEKPIGALTTNPKYNVLTVKTPWLMNTNFSNIGSSLEEPAPVILASRKHHYLMNPQYQSKGSSIDKPCFTLIARMDKMPPYLITTNNGKPICAACEIDTPMMKKIKEFMQVYGIVDIKMRMLSIIELLKIQGFPSDYKLMGTKADQKKFIGNAVHPLMAKAIVEENYNILTKTKELIAA